MNKDQLDPAKYSEHDGTGGYFLYKCTECAGINERVHIYDYPVGFGNITTTPNWIGRTLVTSTSPNAIWLCPSCYARLGVTAIITKKRPRKEHYDMRTRTPGQNAYICTKCSARGLIIYELDMMKVVSGNLVIDPLHDAWLCQFCYDAIGDDVPKKEPTSDHSSCYEGLAVFPLLNGL